MTATAEAIPHSLRITRTDRTAPILIATGRTTLAIRAGTEIEISDGRVHEFAVDTPVLFTDPAPGRDYGIGLDDTGAPVASIADTNPLTTAAIAGFHFAPGGCAEGRAGGDRAPALNPHSFWDLEFRPDCRDPRGMALVEISSGKRFWADIYLLGTRHDADGTSRYGVVIADGRDLPHRPDGTGKVKKLDYATAAEICAHHGKRLLAAEEFFAAAYGVRERCSLEGEPTTTGALDDGAERFTSAWGLFGATGTMWQWGTDGHPDEPRPSLFGGSWVSGSNAGSRYAVLGYYWPGLSGVYIGARAACGHLNPA